MNSSCGTGVTNPGTGDWPRKKRKSPEIAKVSLEMTPMIDVTFQMLIFFMVSTKFRTLEGLLASYMPKEGGPGLPLIEQVLPVRVVLRWNPSIGRCKFYVGQVLCNYDDQGIRRAKTKVLQAVQAGALKAEIDAGGDVPMHWVVQSLNMILETEMKQVNFTASADPLRENR